MDKPLKVYLSGPMDTFENFNYEMFDRVARDLRENFDCEVFSPADYGREQLGGEDSSKQQQPAVRRTLLAGELSWICLSADLVLMLPGWAHSLGARAERATAFAARVPVREIPQDLKIEASLLYLPN